MRFTTYSAAQYTLSAITYTRNVHLNWFNLRSPPENLLFKIMYNLPYFIPLGRIANSTLRECSEIVGQHTKLIFRSLNIFNVFNLYTYFTGIEAMKIVFMKSPTLLSNYFNVSKRSNRLILPSFHYESLKQKSFIYNGSKILNYLIDQDIPYMNISVPVFKTRLKKHLLFIQGRSVNGDDAWLPCNHSLFSDIRFWTWMSD